MDPRQLRKHLEGWWCAGQMSIDEALGELEEADEDQD